MRFFLLLALLLSLPTLSAGPRYSMADLRALEAERSYEEFFAHARDVLPAERTAEWQSLVESMGEGWLKTLKTRPRLERSDYLELEKLMGWRVLARHEFFRHGRQETGLRWFNQCFQDDKSAASPCWSDLVKFWDKERQDADFATRLLALVRPLLNGAPPDPDLVAHRSRRLVTPLFILSPALAGPLAQDQCRKPDVREVVWSEARRLWASAHSPEDFAKDFRSIAHPTCWISLKDYLHGLFLTGASADELGLARHVLRLQSDLRSQEDDLYQLAYLLGSPSRGELFNTAWNRLKALGKEPQRRDEMMKVLRSWEILPGELFADLDQKKRRVIARHLRQHFPEFLDHYALVCIDFYGGRRRFPDGNPAHQCRELFSLAASEKDLLPEASLESFKRAL